MATPIYDTSARSVVNVNRVGLRWKWVLNYLFMRVLEIMIFYEMADDRWRRALLCWVWDPIPFRWEKNNHHGLAIGPRQRWGLSDKNIEERGVLAEVLGLSPFTTCHILVITKQIFGVSIFSFMIQSPYGAGCEMDIVHQVIWAEMLIHSMYSNTWSESALVIFLKGGRELRLTLILRKTTLHHRSNRTSSGSFEMRGRCAYRGTTSSGQKYHHGPRNCRGTHIC